MLRAVDDPSQIERCQRMFLGCVRQALRTPIPNVVVGYQAGSDKFDVVGNNAVWFAYQLLAEAPVPRHWNAFGVDRPVLGRSNSITVEVNVASPWDTRAAGLFARDEATGDVALLHRGTIGGGRKGVGPGAFTTWYEENGGELVSVRSPGGEESAFRVADLQRDRFVHGLESFVDAVSRFKSLVKGDDAGRLSIPDLERRAARAPERPRSSTTATVVYARDPAVAELAKRRAGGKCDLCRRPAPFTNTANEPYLESHHIVWLAHGGADRPENTVALCPNCHRKMHVVADKKDVLRLTRRTEAHRS